jgi:transcriptional regulator with XRE-family HTH domain
MRQRDVARQIGVNKDTIHNWETNRTAPEVCLIPHIIDFLGYSPYDATWSFGQWLRVVRLALGLSHRRFAERVGVDQSTVLKWEREEHQLTQKKWRSIKKFLHSFE